eukprot:14329002-Heterocapsa_arctica.AAC.1
MSMPADENASGADSAPLPGAHPVSGRIGALLRLDEVLVGAQTGITFARVSWPAREHARHPAGIITLSCDAPAIRTHSYVALVTAAQISPLSRDLYDRTEE